MTVISRCVLRSLSFDHNGQLSFRASARYSMSFWSGEIFFAFWMHFSNLENGTSLIREKIRESASSNSFSGNFDFFNISFLCLIISFKSNSGADSFNVSANSRFAVIP